MDFIRCVLQIQWAPSQVFLTKICAALAICLILFPLNLPYKSPGAPSQHPTIIYCEQSKYMLESPTKPLLRIFISYRRTNSSNHAGRLFSELCNHFDEKQIFFDVEKINPGEDFVQVLEAA